MPPENIKKWIKEHYVEPWSEKTILIFNDGTKFEKLIEGILDGFTDIIDDADDDYYMGGEIFSQQFDITVGSKVTEIGVVDPSSYIRSINIPKNVTSISAQAFYDSRQLSSVNILNDNITIGSEAFFQCTALKAFPNSTTQTVSYWFNNGVFGDGINSTYDGPANFTITCKDGTVHAVGIWNKEDGVPEGWDITVTPF